MPHSIDFHSARIPANVAYRTLAHSARAPPTESAADLTSARALEISQALQLSTTAVPTMQEQGSPAGGVSVVTPRRPSIRALSQHECLALLARNHVGRLGFAVEGQVEIQPLHYVYEAGWIYGRTSEGVKLATLAHHQWIAFEVDEVRDTFDWASVIVHGSFHRLDPETGGRDAAAEAHAVRLLRSVVPETLTAEDPVPFRMVVFRIAVGETTGRVASPG
jgi:uncharacterized protein